MAAVWQIIYRQLLMTFRQKTELLNPLVFYIIVACLFPLAGSFAHSTLMQIGPGVIWVAALLATLLSLNKLFNDDYRDGSLEQLVLQDEPLSLLLFAKILAHWLLFALPLIVISPILALMYQLPANDIAALVLSLLLGTPTLVFLGAIIAALTVSLRNNGLLLALILLPLYIPPLIFGASTVLAINLHYSVIANFAILGAMLVLSLTFAPLLTAFALRLTLAYD